MCICEVFRRGNIWKKLYRSYSYPENREGASMHNYKQYLYIYGGHGCGYHNDIWRYNINNRMMREIVTTYKPPACRDHRSILYRDYIIVFGGFIHDQNQHNKYYLNDIYIYFIKQYQWMEFSVNNKPKGRSMHGMCQCNDKLIIHGGYNDKDGTLNDMYWIGINDIIYGNGFRTKWIKMETGITPLYGHLLLSNGIRLYCFGGQNPSKEFNPYGYNDSYSDMKSNNINNTLFTQTLFEGRTSIIDSYLEMHFNEYTIPKLVTNLIQKYCNIIGYNHNIKQMNPRYDHNGCILMSHNNVYMFVYGGQSRDKFGRYESSNNHYLIELH